MSNTPDLINATFEATGAITQWLNVRQLLRDREVKGVVWYFTAFFVAWGIWNIIYYPILGQWFSFTAGIAMCSANLTWVVLALYFGIHKKGS